MLEAINCVEGNQLDAYMYHNIMETGNTFFIGDHYFTYCFIFPIVALFLLKLKSMT